jgi:hypothetical protein
MKLFLAVIFFCNNGQCYFWKSSELFFNIANCEKVLEAASAALDAQGNKNQGVCLPITTNNNI